MMRSRCKNGFTLLEAIIGIVLAALLAAALLPLFQKGILSAYKPINNLKGAVQVSNAMEAIINDYESISTKNAANLNALAAKVNNFSANYGTYCSDCTASATTTTVGLLTDSILVTVSNSNGGTAKHVFTVQSY
jgi:prepilin-type N-terminal cleavage/methylation domain-containing protein